MIKRNKDSTSSNLWSRKIKIKVQIPNIQQQNNGHDCGLFAIANMMEFAANRYSALKEGRLQF